MKKCAITFIALFISLSVASCATMAKEERQTTEKSGDELLKEAVLLSQKVKDFEKTLGIEPSKALSQSVLEKTASSVIWIWIQESGTTAFTKPFEKIVSIEFGVPAEQAPIKWLHIGSAALMSYYFRQGNIFSGSNATITADFAKTPLWRQVNTVIHEDLHSSDFTGADQDALVTPLADIAALAYFETARDTNNIQNIRSVIADRQAISEELIAIAKEIEKVFADQKLSFDEQRNKAQKAIDAHLRYALMFKDQTEGQAMDNVLEAKISHDLGYYGCYGWMVRQYKQTGNFMTLFEKVKKMPAMNLTQLLKQCSSNPANEK